MGRSGRLVGKGPLLKYRRIKLTLSQGNVEGVQRELSSCLKLSGEKKAELGASESSVASLRAELKDLRKRRQEAWEHFERLRDSCFQKKDALKEAKQQSKAATMELDSLSQKTSDHQSHASELTDRLERLRSGPAVDPQARAEEAKAESATSSLKSEASLLLESIRGELSALYE